MAQTNSFTQAGEQLGLSQSAVSRQIQALEESMQASLFHRHARGLMLTEQGEILFNAAKDMFISINNAENILLESKDRPHGPLRITTSLALGDVWLSRYMGEFIKLYPEISPTVVADDRQLDFATRAADVAIRLYPPKGPELIQCHLMNIHHGIYASKEYLQHHGTPMTAEDLRHHQIISYNEDFNKPYEQINWLLDVAPMPGQKRHKSALKLNSLQGMLNAVKGGAGIASLPKYLAYRRKSVVRVLTDVRGPEVPCYYVYPSELKQSKRVKVLLNFLKQKIAMTTF